ncbi:TonB-dependent receptor [Sphingobacterium lumbrici]|uniref:TonB-dependent receptor n=1 Tax=Sphingobacterium lumbrici TaxID=2559600 RepID=UPI0011263ED0|nr:TonB-dependent receptor [Sphingobacterium lumbrici]
MKLFLKKTLGWTNGWSFYVKLFLLFLTVVPDAVAQTDKKMDIQLQAEPLISSLERVAKSYGYTLEFKNGLIPANAKGTAKSYKQTTLPVILDQMLENFSIGYKLDGRSVLLFQQEKNKNEKPNQRIIQGHVTDQNGERLPFANVEVIPLGHNSITSADGSFRFVVPNDRPYNLVVRYMGYEQFALDLGTTPVQNPITVKMLPSTHEMTGVEVKGMRKGEVTALSAMREAPNMQYVLSKEQIERFPDLTIGEALQRVPGITMAYSYGLPQSVIMRGLEAEDGSVSINGNRMPSTEPRYRVVDLNGILASTVERIEVHKTLTPDMEGDGTAGTVNIVTKNPPSGSRFFDANVSGGHNFMSAKENYIAGLTWGQRQNKWGYVMGANYSKTGRGEDRIKKSYGSTFGGEDLYTLLKGIELEATDIERKNLGIQGELNYYLNDNEKFYLRGSYNGYIDEQYQHNQNFGIKKYTAIDHADDIIIEGDGWYRHQERNTLMLSTGGKKFFGQLGVDYDMSYANGFYETDRNYRSLFEQKKLSGNIDLSDPQAPQIRFDQEDVYQAGLFEQKYLRDRKEKSTDRDLNISLNMQHPFRLFSADKGIWKMGGRYRNKSNERNRSEDEYKSVNKLTLEGLTTSFKRNDFFQNSYNLDLFPDALKSYTYLQQNPDLFSFDEAGSIRNSIPDTYTGGESLMAVYSMVNWTIRKLAVVAGVRYERTQIDYTGSVLKLGVKDVFKEDLEVVSTNHFDGFLPSINLRYALDHRTNLRFAMTRSLSRPGYFDLVPWEEAREQNGNIKRGNPNLKQASATNLDFTAEHYLESVGLISLSAFHKDVRDKVYKEKVDQVGGEWDGWTIETPRNGKDAKVYGIELAWQQQFTFLPGFLNGFGVYSNYTRLWSSMRAPNEKNGERVMLPDARPGSGNVAISYEKYGFSGRIAANFYEQFVSSLGGTPEQDRMERGRAQLDFSASQRLTKHLSLFLGINNMTNAPISTGYRDGRPDNDRNYGTWGNLGLRFSSF